MDPTERRYQNTRQFHKFQKHEKKMKKKCCRELTFKYFSELLMQFEYYGLFSIHQHFLLSHYFEQTIKVIYKLSGVRNATLDCQPNHIRLKMLPIFSLYFVYIIFFFVWRKCLNETAITYNIQQQKKSGKRFKIENTDSDGR